MKNILILFSFLIAVVFSGCASTTKGGVVGADRSQFMIVSESAMNKNAALAYSQTLSGAKKANKLNTNATQTQKVRKISQNLIKQVGIYREDAIKWDWQVNVINDDTINAWCMPGGKIVVYTGIIDKLKLTNAELAAIIGHEMAHALREHSREQASSEVAKNIGISVGAAVLGVGEVGASIANSAATLAFSLPFSRKHETEADLMGLELMARAGYNPKAAVSVWEKMSKINDKKTAEFLSTHPSNENRIKELENMLPKVMPLYEASNKQK